MTVDDGDYRAARELAHTLSLPVLESGVSPADCTQYDALLLIDRDSLSLQQTGSAAPGPVVVDFGSSAMRHRRGAGHNELLGRAVGVGKKPALQVLDATAGLGRDSFILADLGCTVSMAEREPVVAALLRSGILRAQRANDTWLRQAMARMSLSQADAREFEPAMLAGIDVIYLDPMFPGRLKSAAVKKEMALFQLLLHGTAAVDDADALLLWAMQQPVARVVVKRPPKAACLAGRVPSHNIGGKAVRYDVYVQHKLA